MKKKVIPFLLALAVILLDQITKLWIVKNIPPFSIGYSFGGDLLRIIHVANKGVAFSLGASLSQNARAILFSLVPLVVIAFVVVIYFRNTEFNSLQRWCICGIVGGGVGNIIDRIFRPQGVVDFIDVKFFGIFGLERWPTFNVADASIVVCGMILIVSFFLTIKNTEETKSEKGVMKNKILFKVVKEQLDTFDAYALLQSGCPDNEFDIEAELIAGKLRKGMGTKQIAAIVAEVMNEQFEKEFKSEEFLEAATKIKTILDTCDLPN